MRNINDTLLAAATICLSIAYQVHCAIHGFDLTDEGYLMSIYQWFGTDVHYAQGAGGYPLTAYMGWLLNSIFPKGGILGMRLWGIILVAITEIIIYCYLKRYFGIKMLLLGLLMQCIFVAQDPKPFGYNTLTALLSSMAFVCLIEGTLRNKKALLLLGGMLLGVNVFVRIPNITYIVFLVVPYLLNADLWNDLKLKQSTRQASIAVVGFLLAGVAAWGFVVHIGADALVIDLIGSIGDTLNGDSTHNSLSLFTKYLENIYLCFYLSTVFLIAMLIATTAHWIRFRIVKLLLWFVAFEIIYRTTYMSASALGDNVLGMMNGLGILGCCYYMTQGKVLRGIAATAILYSLVIPLGSDGGYQTMWVGTWLLLPIGLSGLYQLIQTPSEKQWMLHLNVTDSTQQQSHPLFEFSIYTPKSLRTAFYVCMFAFFAATIAKVENRAYYDPGHKSEKTSAIDAPLAWGIYTVEERTNIVNPLLKEMDKYVNPGDTILVYDSSPMLYYLTQTRPFAGISWPCVFYGQQYVNKFVEAEKETRRMPILVLQTYSSSNKWGKPEQEHYSIYENRAFSSIEMSRNLLRIIKKYHYRTVWTNRYYHIMLPTNLQ